MVPAEARGIEVAAPKSVRDLMKAYRYSQEGVTNVRGDEVIPADNVSVADIMKQALGFNPAKVSEAMDRKNALKNAESRIMNDRKLLISRFASAVAAKDVETKAEVLEKIKEFNRQPINKLVPITKESLQRSIKNRAVNAAKRQDGAMISNKALGIQLRDQLPDRVY
jgi:predicted metal-dependent hydrolase